MKHEPVSSLQEEGLSEGALLRGLVPWRYLRMGEATLSGIGWGGTVSALWLM